MASPMEKTFLRSELEMVQRALKLQTRRCRQLVSEFTRKLQTKELEVLSERQLRDEQLSRVLRSLLVFESRLKQEQKLLRHELVEKDDLIQHQRKELRRLRFTIQFCKTCSQLCGGNPESSDSSVWESCSEICPSEKTSSMSEEIKISFKKNTKGNEGGSKRYKSHRRMTGTYFEVLQLRGSTPDSSSSDLDINTEQNNEINDKVENTFSERMDNIHGIKRSPTMTPDEERISLNSFEIRKDEVDEKIVDKTLEEVVDKIDDKVVVKNEEEKIVNEDDNSLNTSNSSSPGKKLITDTITVFEAGEGESNDNWYASASDQEDDERRDLYRNNPVLECMNQILLQNIKDTNSPPKSPEVERNKNKNQKRVKFIDDTAEKAESDYYETPIQNTNNVYDVPQSIYSNDYEQILNKSDQSPKIDINRTPVQKLKLVKDEPHYYIDMEIEKKPKGTRTPPALPPKPANLISKFKMLNRRSADNLEDTVESEPDYCSISELNLPTERMIMSSSIYSIKSPEKINNNNNNNNMQAPKQPHRSNVASVAQISTLKKKEPEIPKLPQVSEIIIPDEEDSKKDDDEREEDRISQDNYIKNNSQLLKKQRNGDKNRGPIVVGSSVSSLITDFNNRILSEINRKDKLKINNNSPFSNFENSQSYEKQKSPLPNFDKFDLSQNFDEFNLDDCEIGEDFQSDSSLNYNTNDIIKDASSVEIVRATNPIPSPRFQSDFNCQRINNNTNNSNNNNNQIRESQANDQSYEHFLECTGLSSKSILTPSRMLSNHKSMLKPKDVKLRSKAKSTSVFEHPNGTVKYWSEPYL